MFQSESTMQRAQVMEINGLVMSHKADFESRIVNMHNELIRQRDVHEGHGRRDAGGDGGERPTGREPRIRIPAPSGWKMSMLKGKDDGFGGWRDSFDLQIGSVWMQLDKLLVEIRDFKGLFDQE